MFSASLITARFGGASKLGLRVCATGKTNKAVSAAIAMRGA